MAKGKDLPAVDFHAVLAKRDPALAERLAREGLSTAPPEEAAQPLLSVVHAPSESTATVGSSAAAAASRTPRKTSRRGLVPRAEGREAGRITVYVPPQLALRLRAYCFERDLTMTDVAAEVLLRALEDKLHAP